MHVVVRKYSGPGATELFDLIEQRGDEVKDIITGVPGFASYVAFRTGRRRRDRHGLRGQGRHRRVVEARR